MKYLFISVGKERDDLLGEAVDEFTRRIGHSVSVSWKVLPQSKQGSASGAALAANEEGKAILRQFAPGDFIVILDEKGKGMTSPELATLLEKKTVEGVKRIVFVIGGAYGISEEVKQKAQFLWSLSPLTFPHQMARLILSEQIYRALSILSGSKYHHE